MARRIFLRRLLSRPFEGSDPNFRSDLRHLRASKKAARQKNALSKRKNKGVAPKGVAKQFLCKEIRKQKFLVAEKKGEKYAWNDQMYERERDSERKATSTFSLNQLFCKWEGGSTKWTNNGFSGIRIFCLITCK